MTVRMTRSSSLVMLPPLLPAPRALGAADGALALDGLEGASADDAAAFVTGAAGRSDAVSSAGVCGCGGRVG